MVRVRVRVRRARVRIGERDWGKGLGQVKG
jgi:hypothetical protein